MNKRKKDMTPEERQAEKEKRLTIVEHLEELRTRLLRSAIAVAVGTIIGFAFLSKWILHLLESRAVGVQFIAIEVTETLGVYMKIAIYSGFAIAMPVIVYEVVSFVAPALTKEEKKYFRWLLPGVVVSFIIGVLFGFFVLLPPALNFLLNFGSDVALIQPRISNFVSVVAKLLFWIGVVFETPVIMFFLAKMHIVNTKMLSRFRRHAYVASFLLGAIITPTFDPINQTLVAIPLIVLYEIGVFLTRFARKPSVSVMPGIASGSTGAQ